MQVQEPGKYKYQASTRTMQVQEPGERYKFCAAWLTERYFLSGFRRQSEHQQRHGWDEDTRNDEVETVEQSASTDVHGERDVDVLLRTTLVLLHVPLCRHTYNTRSTMAVSYFELQSLSYEFTKQAQSLQWKSCALYFCLRCNKRVFISRIRKPKSHQALRSNNKVLSIYLNIGKDRSGCRSSGGRSFHSRGPPAEKLLSSNLLRVRRTTEVIGTRLKGAPAYVQQQPAVISQLRWHWRRPCLEDCTLDSPSHSLLHGKSKYYNSSQGQGQGQGQMSPKSNHKFLGLTVISASLFHINFLSLAFFVSFRVNRQIASSSLIHNDLYSERCR